MAINRWRKLVQETAGKINFWPIERTIFPRGVSAGDLNSRNLPRPMKIIGIIDARRGNVFRVVVDPMLENSLLPWIRRGNK